MKKINSIILGFAALISAAQVHANEPFTMLQGKSNAENLILLYQPIENRLGGDLPAPSGTLIYLEQAFDELPVVTTQPEIDPEKILISSVKVGAFDALHLVLEGVSEPVEISLSFPDKATKASLQSLTPDEKQMVDSLFLNGSSAVYRQKKSDAKTLLPMMPDPPGDDRLEYFEDQKFYSFDYTALGNPSLNDANLKVLYHGNPVSFATDHVPANHALVYAPENLSTTSEFDSFFVSQDDASPSSEITSRPAFTALSPQSVEMAQTISKTYDPNLIYERGSILPNGERFVAWRVRNGQTFSTTVPFDDLLTTTSVSLSASLLGYTSNSADPDHYADLKLNDVAIPRFSWEDRTQATLNAQVDLPVIPDPAEFTLAHSVDIASPFNGGADFQNLDTFTVTYEAYPRISAGGSTLLTLPETGSDRLITVGNLPSSDSAIVADVSDPSNPVLIQNPSYFNDLSGTMAVEFEDAGSAATYLIQLKTEIAEFSQIVSSENFAPLPVSEFNSVGDIFVRDEVYANELQRLINSLPSASYSFTPQAAYNAYNHGQASPEAIQQALADVVARTPRISPIPNITLEGDASFDRKNLLQMNEAPQIPVFIEDSFPTGGIAIETSSDFNYTLLQGTDQFPDAQIGRFTVLNEQELAIVIDRALAHAQVANSLVDADRVGLFVTDNEAQFLNEIPFLTNEWEKTGRASARVDIDGVTDTEEIEAILESENGGAAFVLYTGHGNENRWAAEQVVTNDKVPDFLTENKWPIVASFTCLNGNYAFPGNSSRTLSEIWLITPVNGSPYNVSPSSVDGFPQHILFSQEAMLAFSQNHPVPTAGRWMYLSLTRYLTSYPSLDRTARSYGIFGYPGTSMAFTVSDTNSSISDYWILNGD